MTSLTRCKPMTPLRLARISHSAELLSQLGKQRRQLFRLAHGRVVAGLNVIYVPVHTLSLQALKPEILVSQWQSLVLRAPYVGKPASILTIMPGWFAHRAEMGLGADRYFP